MLEILEARILERPNLVHGFTTRHGGVSRGPYAHLNLSASCGDGHPSVAENRARVGDALGLDVLAFADQVHGSSVLTVDNVQDDTWSVGEGDALITDRPGIGLVAQTADCTPALIFDPELQAVAAVHSGWRGVVRNVVGAAVSALTTVYGSNPSDLVAALGPAISKARYRVGPEVLAAVERAFGAPDDGLVGPRDGEGGATLDVSEAVRRQLVGAGLWRENVERLAICTYEDSRFFSSRRARKGPFGSQGGIIGLIGRPSDARSLRNPGRALHRGCGIRAVWSRDGSRQRRI